MPPAQAAGKKLFWSIIGQIAVVTSSFLDSVITAVAWWTISV